jgi:hypothetical protein
LHQIVENKGIYIPLKELLQNFLGTSFNLWNHGPFFSIGAIFILNHCRNLDSIVFTLNKLQIFPMPGIFDNPNIIILFFLWLILMHVNVALFNIFVSILIFREYNFREKDVCIARQGWVAAPLFVCLLE